MALSKLSEDQHRSVFGHLCNVLEPCDAVDFSCASKGLRTATQALLQQLRADHEVAAALCHKVGLRSCKELRETMEIGLFDKGLSSAELATMGTLLGSVLPALESLVLSNSAAGPDGLQLSDSAAGPDGVQQLAAGLGAGALPAVARLAIGNMHTGDAGASSLAAALGRGALPRLVTLILSNAAIGDAGLVALAPALRRLPALDCIFLSYNPLGDEGIAALVAPPPSGALSPPTGALTKLKALYFGFTQVSDAGCTALAAALDSGTLPALDILKLDGIPASAAAKAAVIGAHTMAQDIARLRRLGWEQH